MTTITNMLTLVKVLLNENLNIIYLAKPVNEESSK